MIAGKRYDGSKSDIWSLGVCLFACLSGFLPFEDSNTAKLYKKILSASYKPPSFLSTSAKDLIARILNPDPATRPTIAQIRDHPWCGLVGKEKTPRHRLSAAALMAPPPVEHPLLEEKKENEETTEGGEENSTSTPLSDPSSGLSHIHPELVADLDSLGIDKKELSKALDKKKLNSLTATYKILRSKLLKKKLSEGGVRSVEGKVGGGSGSSVTSSRRSSNHSIRDSTNPRKPSIPPNPHPPRPKSSHIPGSRKRPVGPVAPRRRVVEKGKREGRTPRLRFDALEPKQQRPLTGGGGTKRAYLVGRRDGGGSRRPSTSVGKKGKNVKIPKLNLAPLKFLFSFFNIIMYLSSNLL